MDYPANCLVCELYKTCRAYKQRRVDNGHRKVDILLVGSNPPASGTDMLDTVPGQYLKKWLAYWDGPWAYTTVIKCATPDQKDPHPHQVQACRRYLQEDIEQCDPQVIIALGSAALKALWPEGPTSVVKAKGAPIQIGSRWLLVTYAPAMHTGGRQDLTAEYTRAFELATQICEGSYDTDKPDIREVKDEDSYRAMMSQIQSATEVCLDVENPTCRREDDPSRYTFWMVQPSVVCLGVGTAVDAPVWVMRRQWVTRDLLALMARKRIVGQNVKHDLTSLAWDVWPEWLDTVTDIEDTMLWHGSRDQSQWGNGLKEMAERYLGAANWLNEVTREVDAERERILVARREQIKRRRAAEKAGLPWDEEEVPWPTFCDVPWPKLMEYNGRDVWYTMRLLEYFRKNIEPADVYRSLLLPGTLLLARMEVRGVGADAAWRKGLEIAHERKSLELRSLLHRFPEIKRLSVKQGLTCEPDDPKTWFNPKSQLHKIALLEECNVEVTEKTATGAPKLDKRVVQALIDDGHKVWAVVQALTQTRDRLSKFIVPMEHHIARDSRVHANFKAAKVVTASSEGSEYSGGTETGRLAVSDPAMHNSVKDPVFRRMFKAREGHVLLEMDHSAIEVRVVAWLSGCDPLARMFDSERDVYVQMAERMFRKSGLTKSSPERTLAKTGTLAKIYRQGAAGLASRAGIPLHEAVEFQAGFDKQFPQLEEWQQSLIKSARKGEMYRTVFGRQWTFTEDATDNEIVNRPVQSSATDLCFWQAINADLHHRIIMFTHDSHLLEVLESRADELAVRHMKWMENREVLPVEVTVPLVVEIKRGVNWGKMEVWKP